MFPLVKEKEISDCSTNLSRRNAENAAVADAAALNAEVAALAAAPVATAAAPVATPAAAIASIVESAFDPSSPF